MTIASVIRDVCLTVGVAAPAGSVFPASNAERTKAEMISLANEMAARIGFDTRDWTALRREGLITSDGAAGSYPVPANFHRMVKTGNIYRGGDYNVPMRFISGHDEWYRTNNQIGSHGDWMLMGRSLWIRPVDAFGTTYEFPYLSKDLVTGAAFQERFLIDTDEFVLDERLLKLGMIWQWRAYKGGAYTEDMQNYEDALATLGGADKPAPILVSGRPVSSLAASVGWPYPLGPPP